MSKLTKSDIFFKNHDAEYFKTSIEKAHSKGKQFRGRAYHLLRNFIDDYNQKNPNDPTSINEVVFLLCGWQYTAINALFRGNPDFSGMVKTQNQEARAKKPSYHAEKVAARKFEKCLQTKKKNWKECDIIKELGKITENGEIDLQKNPGLAVYLRKCAREQNTTLEAIIEKTGYKVTKIKRKRNTVSFDEHVRNIRACVNNNKDVVFLASRFPKTRFFLRRYAIENGYSLDMAVNKLLGDETQSHHYISQNTKESIYHMSNANFIANNNEKRQQIVSAIMSCMDENGYVVGLTKADQKVYQLLHKISVFNSMSVEEVVLYFVPNAKYKGHIPPTEVEIAKLLKKYDDGTGCVDKIRIDEEAYGVINLRARVEKLSLANYVEKFGFHITKYARKSKLSMEYGEDE